MSFDIKKASMKLSQLDLNIISDNLEIDVLWFRVMTIDGNWNIARHMHSSFEFHIVVEGECKVITDSGEFHVQKGEFYLTAPGVLHEQSSVNDRILIEYSLNCDLKLAEDMECEEKYVLDALTNRPFQIYKDRYSVSGLFANALEEAFYERLGYYGNIKQLVSLIVNTAARTMAIEGTGIYRVPVKKRKNDFRFTQIEKFVKDNIAGPVQVGDIAHFMYLSDRHVCRIIKEKTGMNTRDYIMSFRLEKAKELLKDTSLTIKQIADMLGFSSEYYFNQFFSREEGYPPGFYKRNIQNV